MREGITEQPVELLQPCRRCRVMHDSSEGPWCRVCHYPGIADDWQQMQDLVAEGHSRHQAAVLSGYMGAEEI